MQPPPIPDDVAPARRRWIGIDVARGLALIAMAAFHLSWDLSLFGLIETDISAAPIWRAFAATIAGSFLTLVGIGLVLAHGAGIRWAPFLRRLAILAGAALTVTTATWFVFPDSFIYFGILHAIAVSSLLALPFIRAPTAIAAVAACACFLAPTYLASPVFNAPGWIWLGLSTAIRPTNDYEPILPWFGFVLTGIVIARIVAPRLPALPSALAASGPARLLAFLGRHSLAVYLLHQPILFGLVWLAAQAIGPLPATGAAFAPSCEAQCRGAGQSEAVCIKTCTCAGTGLKDAGLWEGAVRNHLSREARQRVTSIVQQCLSESQ